MSEEITYTCNFLKKKARPNVKKYEKIGIFC